MAIFKSLNEENGSYILSHYGQYPAFCFNGSKDFVERTINLFENFGVIKNGHYKHLHDGTCYILAPVNKLMAAIKNTFRSEIILNHLVKIEKKYKNSENEEDFEIEFDEAEVDNMAQVMAEEFWDTKVEKKDILRSFTKTEIDFHAIGSYNDMQIDKICE